MFCADSEFKEPIARIETAPIIGVFAALLALFLLAVSPPALNAAAWIFQGCVLESLGSPVPREMQVAIDAEGALSLHGQPIDAVLLEEQMRVVAAAGRPTVVTLHVAKKTKFHAFAEVLVAAHRYHLRVSPGAAE